MVRNRLRSVIGQVARGGRSVVPRRNFSSPEASNEAVGRVVNLGLRFAASVVMGYLIGYSWEKRDMEEAKKKLRQEYAMKYFVGADASSPRVRD